MSPRKLKGTRKLGAKRLASKYVAIVRGKGRNERLDGTQKRPTFEDAKAWGRKHVGEGAIVELRKDTDAGGIIERVVLVRDCGQWRWKQAFET